MRKHVMSCLILAALLSACATEEHSVRIYDKQAESHEKSAEDWGAAGYEQIAEYHEEEAARARHNSSAASCGLVGIVIFDILLDSDACVEKP